MPRTTRPASALPLPFLLLPLFLLSLATTARAEEAPAEETIRWSQDLPAAFAEAKEAQKILMVCVNARHVTGRAGEEPAAKGLREVVYKDARVVAKSREFVCALLTSAGSAEDFGELRALEISGNLVSPQHIFVDPDGDEVLLRREYWPYGKDERGVQALLDMMEKAKQRLTGEAATPDSPPPVEAGGPPGDAAGRAEWIQEMVGRVVDGAAAERKAAVKALALNDQSGDCVGPLVELFDTQKKNPVLLAAIVRGLGRDGLESAALPIAGLLKHKDLSVRGNAAVSLEYIGHQDKKVVAALRKAADKEKDEDIANHLYRALGRCGAGDAKVRALLLKKAESAKSEFLSYGPCIGLAYFEQDAKAARGVEKMLKKIGVPGSRRGGGQNTVKRGLVSWTLAAIGDPKSGDFMREELIAGLEHVQAFWVAGLRGFWEMVARKCDGDESLLPGIEEGVRGFVSFAKGRDLARYGAETRSLMDEYRKDRDTTDFRPKGDWILTTGSDR